MSVARALCVAWAISAAVGCGGDESPSGRTTRDGAAAAAGRGDEAGAGATASGGAAAGSGGAGATGGIGRGGMGAAASGLDASALDASLAEADASAGAVVDASTPDGSADARAALDASVFEAGIDAASGADAALACGSDGGSPSGAYQWHVYYPGAFADHLEVDSTGAAVVSGSFFGDMSVGGKALAHTGGADVHLARILATGTVDWVRTYGGNDAEYPLNLVLDAADRIYMTGLYDGTANVGGGDLPTFAGTAGRFDPYVAAYDASGSHRWSTSFNTTDEGGLGAGLSVDGAGHLYLAASYRGGMTTGSGTTASLGSWDAAYVRLDEPSGAVGADVRLGSAGDERGVVAVADGSGVTFVLQFAGSLTIPTSPSPTTVTSAGGFDMLVLRLDADGAIVDHLQLGGDGDDEPIQGVLAPDGTVLITGITSSTDLVLGAAGSYATEGGDDVFVLRLDGLSVVDATVFGGVEDDRPREIAVGRCGAVAVVGEFRRTLALGSDVLIASGAEGGSSEIDAFVIKMTSGLSPSWSRAFGGPSGDRGLGIGLDAAEAVYFTASFQSDVDFGGGVLAAGGGWSSAVVRLSP